MDSEALSIARGRLVAASPWLATAFGRLADREQSGIARCGTDGTCFFYDPGWLANDDRRAAVALAHATAHCLLGHPLERGLGALEADMAVALLLDALLPGFCPAHGAEVFMQARHRLSGLPLNRIAPAMAADPFFAEQRDTLTELLTVDDHGLWRPEANLVRPSGEAGDGWTDLRRMALGRLRGRRAGRGAGGESRRYRPEGAPDRSYRALLSNYVEWREEPREDPDTFERNLYAYGLATYGNLPIVEPAETREARHIDELAIVIDTSGSCLETLTARFLDETRAMMANGALFARRFNLRILQCDAAVRRDDHITCLRDFERYIDDLEIVGGGGTDFRPAFAHIDRLVNRGAFRRLRLALFFSDGMGLFPSEAPDYDVVFTFFRGQYDDIDVPGWARKFVLEE